MDKIFKKLASGCLLALSTSAAYCGDMGSATTVAPELYLGVFGGGGAMSRADISLAGTAFFTEALGGPLAVNAYGRSDTSSNWMVGGHVGYSWLSNLGLYFPLSPALELEAYYIGEHNVVGRDFINPTERLDEHNFVVTYPLKTGVFLVNALVNANNPFWGNLRPYLGIGLGSALLSINGATAYQVGPPEPGVNHYNGGNDEQAFAFAAQPKIGLHYDFSPHTSFFAEYRFLYISQSNYIFGSTVYPGHAATAPWQASIRSQYYNMGTVGVNFDI